jgi:hypothetical protein
MGFKSNRIKLSQKRLYGKMHIEQDRIKFWTYMICSNIQKFKWSFVLQLPQRRGAIIDWATEMSPFSFSGKGYGWLQLLLLKKH